MAQNPANNNGDAGADNAQQENNAPQENNAGNANFALPALPRRHPNRLQLAWDPVGIYPVDTQGEDLLPYQVHLLQNADAPTLQRYKDRILLAYAKALEYCGGSEEEGEAAVREKVARGEDVALREMCREVNNLFREMYGPWYDWEVRRNVAYMGGGL